jgi:hypothetical protein
MSARPGLCGGHRATGVPTAINSYSETDPVCAKGVMDAIDRWYPSPMTTKTFGHIDTIGGDGETHAILPSTRWS